MLTILRKDAPKQFTGTEICCDSETKFNINITLSETN
jgi:hypothetical protein